MPELTYPALHSHEKEPAVSVQVACAWQLCVVSVHSSSLVQLTPSPEYPVSHAHVKDPNVFVQFELTWQLWSPFEHSSTSLHSQSFADDPSRHQPEPASHGHPYTNEVLSTLICPELPGTWTVTTCCMAQSFVSHCAKSKLPVPHVPTAGTSHSIEVSLT
eukprot:CAMPEP_0180175164 /NCGR_PEP_ID=MMETSP0986-20121125/36570_1 /TAXON_ID=697907 /ORGANISM="non described non described, Strain CCMP2293" /LENGTH=159 /DNA_ID=CAMNT_0022127615 /DNA_START=38 /DNA_END=517 /DNA_ORIENTATION=-